MKKYLITYSDGEVLSISDAPEGGTIVSGVPFIIETLENAKIMLKAIGIQIDQLESIGGVYKSD